MQYIDKHLIIERYIGGAMSPEEIRNFHALLETDGELRSMFQAENLINSTVARERSALEAVDHSQTYAKFLKGLADSIPQAATTASAGTAGAGGTTSWLAGVGTSVKLAVSAAVLTGSVVVGTLVFQSQSTPQAVPAQQSESPALPAPSVQSDGQQQQPATVRQPDGSTAPAGGTTTPAATTPSPRQPQQSAGRPQQEQQTKQAQQTKQEQQDDIPVFENNTTTLEVRPERQNK